MYVCALLFRCVDEWLRSRDICPMCKTTAFVDLDLDLPPSPPPLPPTATTNTFSSSFYAAAASQAAPRLDHRATASTSAENQSAVVVPPSWLNLRRWTSRAAGGDMSNAVNERRSGNMNVNTAHNDSHRRHVAGHRGVFGSAPGRLGHSGVGIAFSTPTSTSTSTPRTHGSQPETQRQATGVTLRRLLLGNRQGSTGAGGGRRLGVRERGGSGSESMVRREARSSQHDEYVARPGRTFVQQVPPPAPGQRVVPVPSGRPRFFWRGTGFQERPRTGAGSSETGTGGSGTGPGLGASNSIWGNDYSMSTEDGARNGEQFSADLWNFAGGVAAFNGSGAAPGNDPENGSRGSRGLFRGGSWRRSGVRVHERAGRNGGRGDEETTSGRNPMYAHSVLQQVLYEESLRTRLGRSAERQGQS